MQQGFLGSFILGPFLPKISARDTHARVGEQKQIWNESECRTSLVNRCCFRECVMCDELAALPRGSSRYTFQTDNFLIQLHFYPFEQLSKCCNCKPAVSRPLFHPDLKQGFASSLSADQRTSSLPRVDLTTTAVVRQVDLSFKFECRY